MRLRVSHQQSQFWPILARFMGYYSPLLGPGAISMIDDPRGVRLRVSHQNSQFWPILARLMSYYSRFWCPRVIFMVAKLQGALTCRSLILNVLVDPGPFYVLLVTVLGSRSDFHN